MVQKAQSWQLEKIRGQADKQTNGVTSSLLELLVAARNYETYNNKQKEQVFAGNSKFQIEMCRQPFQVRFLWRKKQCWFTTK